MDSLFAYIALLVTAIIVIIGILLNNKKTKDIGIISALSLLLIIIAVGAFTLPNIIRQIRKENNSLSASQSPILASSATPTSLNEVLATQMPERSASASPVIDMPQSTPTGKASSYEPNASKIDAEIYIQTMLVLIQVYTYHNNADGTSSLGYSEDGCTYPDPLEIKISGLDEEEGELWKANAIYLNDGIYKIGLPSVADRIKIQSTYFTYTTSFSTIITSSYYSPDEYYLSTLKLLTIFPSEGSLDNCLSIKNLDYDTRSKNYVVNLDRSAYGLEPIDHFIIAEGNYLVTYKDNRQKEITISNSGVFDFSY